MAAAIPTSGATNSDVQQTWSVYQDMLLKLTTSLGELNQDQYYMILDVAAHLTAGVSAAPYIGGNGNWFIGDTDTGVSAQPPYIGTNGHWWIGSSDTGVPATGPQGPPGAQGVPGSGLKILGTYSSLSGLQAAHPTGSPGDAYLVGSGGSYNLYLWDTGTNAWVTGGPLTAGIPDAPPGSPQPYVRNGQTVAWEPLSNYISGSGGAYVPLTGGTMTGTLTINGSSWPQLVVAGSYPTQQIVEIGIGQWMMQALYSAGTFGLVGPGPNDSYRFGGGLLQVPQLQVSSTALSTFLGPVGIGAGSTPPTAAPSGWAGVLFFNTTTSKMQFYDGVVWRTITST